MIVFLSPCFAFWFLIVVVANIVYSSTWKKEQPTLAGWLSSLPCGQPIEHLPIMTPKPDTWVPRFAILRSDIFIMGGILWLNQTQGLFIICAPDTDVTENSHSGCLWTAGHHKKLKNKQKSWPFSTMLEFGWSPIVLQIPSSPVLLIFIVPITIIFRCFFYSLARSKYLSFFSVSFSFILCLAGTAKSTILQFLFFFLDYYKIWSSCRD